MKNKILIGTLVLAFILGVTGCQEKGPAEKAGEKIDNVASDAKDNAKDALETAGDKIENATD